MDDKIINMEQKWQEKWQQEKTFVANKDINKTKYYVLEMFPYPSGNLHMGHVRNYAQGDVIARFKKLQGYNVLHPMGWDAFGLPAENAAIEQNSHPQTWTKQNINKMRKQMKSMGLSIDWSKELSTCDPNYYKHEQKVFLELFAKGLAYKKESLINWDPVDKTVLANEQVINGCGWRTGAKIEKKLMNQWFIKITNYAEELLTDLEKLNDWPDNVKTMQQQWIGKSIGINIDWKIITGSNEDKITIFTTKPEVIFGATCIVISQDHFLAKDYKDKINFTEDYDDHENNILPGILTKIKVQHPLIAEQVLPVYIGNFVIMSYGTGAIFACPAHSHTDMKFAKLHNIEPKPVINTKNYQDIIKEDYKHMEASTEDGVMINSQFLNGMSNLEARHAIIKHMENIGVGKSKIYYKLRDWGISRQRYWGCPIPIIYCQNCGIMGAKQEDLPIVLPKQNNKNDPEYKKWMQTNCPKCNGNATRETDTFDTFFESSWYFIRFCDPNNKQNLADKDLANYWLPVDQYIGGIEHAILHLIYARFFVKVLRDLQYLNKTEPFAKLFTQGLVCHQTYKSIDNKWLHPSQVKLVNKQYVSTKDGNKVTLGKVEKMSKSKKNTVDPEEMINKYGADTIRLFILSDNPGNKNFVWHEEGISGASKFLNRLYAKTNQIIKQQNQKSDYENQKITLQNHNSVNKKTIELVNKTIELVTNNLDNIVFNKAIANIRELFNITNDLPKLDCIYCINAIIKLIAPITPHIAEELWQMLGNTSMIVNESWPQYYTSKDNNNYIIQINGKFKKSIAINENIKKEQIERIILTDPLVQKNVKDKVINKIININNKIYNILLS